MIAILTVNFNTHGKAVIMNWIRRTTNGIWLFILILLCQSPVNDDRMPDQIVETLLSYHGSILPHKMWCMYFYKWSVIGVIWLWMIHRGSLILTSCDHTISLRDWSMLLFVLFLSVRINAWTCFKLHTWLLWCKKGSERNYCLDTPKCLRQLYRQRVEGGKSNVPPELWDYLFSTYPPLSTF